jgi:acetyl esterase/lipase
MYFNKFTFLFLISLSISLVSCDTSDDSADDTMEEEVAALTADAQENVSYGESDEQVYDLYLPAGRLTTKTKVIILVHGGGWIEGDKVDMNGFLALIQNNHPDHAIVNMNYKLATATQTAFPSQFLDVQLVIDHLIENAADYQIKAAFGLIGVSAGAHISLMYDYVYDTDDLVKFVGDVVGPSNFTDPFYSENPNFNLLLSLFVDEAAYPAGADLAVVTSPALQVSSAASPTVMFYGDQDPLVPLSGAQSLDAALTAQGTIHAFNVFEGGHGNDWSAEDQLSTQIQLSSYINTYLAIN